LNRRSNVFLEFNGERHQVSVWAEKIGMTRSCLAARLKRGWSVESALTTPIQKSRWGTDAVRLR
jgi:hypothetical protein